jgi:chromosome partitioning protein
MDLRAMTKTIDLMKLVKVPSFAVLNGVQHHSLGAATEAEKTITRILGLPVCPVRVGERVAYNRCLITGQAAQELEPESKAASEIRRLAKWIDEQMKVPT